jgi:ATP-dependent RNA circularization protein (DNA/RNA ligase family)
MSRLTIHFPGRNVALLGEIIGFGVQGNIHGLRTQNFQLFDIFDIDQKAYLSRAERQVIATQMALEQAPLIDSESRLPLGVKQTCVDRLLQFAYAASALKSNQLREGLVFKAKEKRLSFKVVSNKYLLKQPA